MCINKMEMEKKMEELKSMKRMKEELEEEIRSLENDIIGYLVETPECEAVNKSGKPIRQYIGSVFKATYGEQSRESVDAKKVKDILTAEQYESVSKTSTYNVLRVS